MGKIIKLTESDLRHMVRKTINEMMAMEGGEEPQYPGDRYYFNGGFAKGNSRPPKAGYYNPFTAEGGIGEGYEELVSQLQEYVSKTLEEMEGRKGAAQRAFDNFLKSAEKRHGSFSRNTQREHERKNRLRNGWSGKNYPEYLHPSGHDQHSYDRYLAAIANEDNDNKRWLESKLRLEVEMPIGGTNVRFWGDYALSRPTTKTFSINPENVEDAVKQAMAEFNSYAEQVPEVIGWWLWSCTGFPPTIMPILTPDVGSKIERVAAEVRDYYDSKPSGGYTGD